MQSGPILNISSYKFVLIADAPTLRETLYSAPWSWA